MKNNKIVNIIISLIVFVILLVIIILSNMKTYRNVKFEK